jgi:hypothetical protein
MNDLSRRHFIRNTSTALFSVALFNPLGSLFVASKKENKLPSWTELVDYARWCPTVHNLQPHQIKIISDNEAELYYNPSRLIPVGDPESIFATVAMGIFIENLSIASAIYGQKVEIKQIINPIDVKSTSVTLFAKLKLVTSDEKEVLNRELILKRKTSRLHYNGKPLSDNLLDKMKNETESFNHEFFSTSDEDSINAIIQLNQETLFEDLESKPMRDELNQLFRYDKEEAEVKKDGLWAKCMGFSGSLMKSVFINHEKWTKGLRRSLLSHNYKNSFKGTSTVCWFGGDFNNAQDWTQAGRMFARNWLLLTQENAYLQPFGSLITNEEAYKKINQKFQQPASNKKIWMIFRAGYSNEPTRSFRLNTNEIIIK